MIKIEKTNIYGWESAIRGLRNPMNSWGKIDSQWYSNSNQFTDGSTLYYMGNNDLDLMKRLVKAGSDHSKFMRFIIVTCDITAPLYWWKQADQYRIGVTTNSCSTMHCLTHKPFEMLDFSHDHLDRFSTEVLAWTIKALNVSREDYLKTNDKEDWWQMIQLLPSSYNQKRTVQLNYQVLRNMYFARRNHKLDEWVEFCKWIETLPYFKELCLDE